MCLHFAPGVTGQCREEEAEEVLDKTKANFCDWFAAAAGAFDANAHAQSMNAQTALHELFGGGEDKPAQDLPPSAADDLFK